MQVDFASPLPPAVLQVVALSIKSHDLSLVSVCDPTDQLMGACVRMNDPWLTS